MSRLRDSCQSRKFQEQKRPQIVREYVCVCVRLWHSENRAGPPLVARRNLTVDEWRHRCLSIFSSKHPEQAGRRGSWEHEVVLLWTADFQFKWKVKPLWRCQHQPRLKTPCSFLLAAHHVEHTLSECMSIMNFSLTPSRHWTIWICTNSHCTFWLASF